MSDPKSILWDVVNEILCVVNQMERNTTTEPPSQTSLLMQTQPTKQMSSPMQICQTSRSVSQIQSQISQTSSPEPSSFTGSEFNQLLHSYRKNSPSSGSWATEKGNPHRCVKLLFIVFCLGRNDTKNVPGTEEKVELVFAEFGEKRVTFPFTDSNVEFLETMWENYPMLKDIKFYVFHAEKNAKEWCLFNQLLLNIAQCIYKMIITKEDSLMKEDVVYLENGNMHKVKEAFDIFWYFSTYIKMSPKENALQVSKDKSRAKLMSHKSHFKNLLDSIVNKFFFCDE